MPAIPPGQRKKPARKAPAKTSTKSKVGTRAQLDSWKPPPKAPAPLIRPRSQNAAPNWRKAAATPRTAAQKKRDAAMAELAKTTSAAGAAFKRFTSDPSATVHGSKAKAFGKAGLKAKRQTAAVKRKYGGSKAPTTRKRKTGPQ